MNTHADYSKSIKDDLNRLHESVTLLKVTTENVSTEAVATAAYLRKELSQTVYRFFNVIESVNDLILIKDGRGRWKTLNVFGRSVFGFKRISDYFNKTDCDLARDFPSHASGLDYCIESDRKAWGSAGHYRCFEIFNVNGKQRIFDVMKTPVFEDGNRKELIIIGRDITDLKEAQLSNKSCMAALNSASDLLVIIDPKGFITFVNNSFVQVFGFASYSDAVDQSLFDILGDSCIDYTTCDSAILQEIDAKHIWTENIIISKDNCDKKYFITILPVMNGSEKPAQYICRLHPTN